MKDCSTVFALSTMVSSVLVYNLMHNLQEDDLQHLQFFTEYGRLALDETADRPFQHLIFLIRDWPYPYECAFGYEGGEQVLRKRLLATDSKHPQLVHVRQGLQRTFQRIRCFLMPHPGMAVTTSAQYDGRHSLMEEDFKQHLLDFTESVLAPENLVVKKIGGSVVKCRDLFEYMKAYARVYQGRELPEPKTLYLATAEANNLAASAAGRASYAREMDAALAAASPQRPLTSDGLRRRHSAARAAGLRAFDARRKLGGPDFCAEYRARLAAELDAQLEAYERRNAAKAGAGAFFRAPILLLGCAVFLYLGTIVLRLLTLHGGADSLNSIGNFFVLLFLIWVASWYTGVFSELRNAIENASQTVWAMGSQTPE